MHEALAVAPEYASRAERDKQFRYDLRTQFAELVDGNMRTEFELAYSGNDLIGEDGSSLKNIADKSLTKAKTLAKLDGQLWFEVRRRSLEKDEIQEAIDMAGGDRPNTMIICSDFPAELIDAKEDMAGYNVNRKQTMLRILTRQQNGNIKMYSQSLDGSNRKALEAIFARFGIESEPGELLGQRIHVDLSSDGQANIIDELTGIYDRSLASQFGGDWYAGRRPADYRNTYDFVCRQTDLIEECIRLKKLGWLNEQSMYEFAATMQERFSASKLNWSYLNIKQELARIDPASLYAEIKMAATQARRMGMSFSACGATLRSEGFDNSTENQLDLAGYGNKTSLEEADCEYISKECPECHEKNVKTKVHRLQSGKKIISGSCGCAVIK